MATACPRCVEPKMVECCGLICPCCGFFRPADGGEIAVVNVIDPAHLAQYLTIAATIAFRSDVTKKQTVDFVAGVVRFLTFVESLPALEVRQLRVAIENLHISLGDNLRAPVATAIGLNRPGKNEHGA